MKYLKTIFYSVNIFLKKTGKWRGILAVQDVIGLWLDLLIPYLLIVCKVKKFWMDVFV